MWLGAQWFSARSDLADQQARLLTLEGAALTGEAITKVREATLAAQNALSDVRARVRATLGYGTSAAGLLDAVALATPGDVRLGSIEFSIDKDRLVCRIAGFVLLSESADPTGAITVMADAIKATPIVKSARLGATQRTRVAGVQAHAFDLLVELVPLPADLLGATGGLDEPGLASVPSAAENLP